jgi:hypothetical protein
MYIHMSLLCSVRVSRGVLSLVLIAMIITIVRVSFTGNMLELNLSREYLIIYLD